MAESVAPHVRVYPDLDAMSRGAAEGFVDMVARVAGDHGSFSMALSGGSTPKCFYQTIAREFIDRVPWERVMIFWGDERYVPRGHPQSNFHMFHDALLDNVKIPLGNIHPMPTHRKRPQDAARDYETFLRSKMSGPWPRFDLVMLGMGGDGHVASLFPGSPALAEREQWVVAAEAPIDPTDRLTITLPVINAARHVCFIVAGEAKAETLNRVLSGGCDAAQCPAAGIKPVDGRIMWWVDEAAASKLGAAAEKMIRIQRYAGR